MSDLDAALEPVREILERREAERRNGTSRSDSLETLLAATAALQQPALVNGSVAPAEAAASPDWEQYERNRADIREIVKKLRNGGH
ncbi:MAG TPA: hypothetical protein VJ653_02550 [Acidimicrobiales bacterium]|nr:hypothetical protein [Acidimicrobiales bacterium]